MLQRIKAALFPLLLLPALAAANPAEDQDIVFDSLPYPVKLAVAPAHSKGAVCFESDFSRQPAADYDTVLIQGLLPDADLRVDLQLKTEAGQPPEVLSPVASRRFPNGRFWAKYKTGAPTRRPIKIQVFSLGAGDASTITLYGTELSKTGVPREEPQASTFTYVPDPALSVPDSIPFKLVRRAQWGAKPPKEAYTRHQPVYFTIHHTQSHYPATYADAVTEMQFIQDFHQNGRGWIDIAYHFLIDPMGNVFEGRPIYALGAHVKGHNTGNVGISIMGDYHPPTHNVFTQATENSFVTVGRYLKDTYSVNISSFYAHRELGPTDCPGDDLYAKKPELTGLIFTPKVDDAQAQINPAQQRALDRLMKEINSGY